MDLIFFRTKYNVSVLIYVFLDLLRNLFAWFHIDIYIFLHFSHIHRYNIETYKVNFLSSVMQRKKMGCKILAFLFLIGAVFNWVLF